MNSNGSEGNGIGLENIRKRLESYFGNEASLTVAARDVAGTEAVIVIPIEKNKSA
jgi:sensor histidine kinase YesM